MSFACRGLTHCKNCLKPLKINESLLCNICREEKTMSKTYKGYELMKDIAEGKIKERN